MCGDLRPAFSSLRFVSQSCLRSAIRAAPNGRHVVHTANHAVTCALPRSPMLLYWRRMQTHTLWRTRCFAFVFDETLGFPGHRLQRKSTFARSRFTHRSSTAMLFCDLSESHRYHEVRVYEIHRSKYPSRTLRFSLYMPNPKPQQHLKPPSVPQQLRFPHVCKG